MASTTTGACKHHQLRVMLKAQHGVVTAAQAAELGISRGALRAQVDAGRWLVLHHGVYFAVNGRPGRGARMWAALLACGDGAVLSHRTAAHLFGFGPETDLIEVSIPNTRQEVAVAGIRIRRSRLLPGKQSQFRGWPVTAPADTVLDLIGETRSPFRVVGLLTDACRTRRVSAEQILHALSHRRRQRHRQLIKDVLNDVVGGVESPLEHKYLLRVERAHGLPVGRRQVKSDAYGAPIRQDVEYDEFATVVELDGRAGHEGSGQHRDRRRDNSNTVRRKATLRYGHADVETPCEVAQEVADVITPRGWTGNLRPCGPRCRITR